MKNLILFISLFICSASFGQTYKITRYEQKSDALFICINSTVKPVYLEHYLTEAERKDDKAITATIERLIAELQVKADDYIEPEKYVSKMDKALTLKVDTVKIAVAKVAILAKITAEKDSIAKIVK